MNPIEQAELTRIKRENAKLRFVRSAAQALINDVRRRYPREELTCECMRALDQAIKNSET